MQPREFYREFSYCRHTIPAISVNLAMQPRDFSPDSSHRSDQIPAFSGKFSHTATRILSRIQLSPSRFLSQFSHLAMQPRLPRIQLLPSQYLSHFSHLAMQPRGFYRELSHCSHTISSISVNLAVQPRDFENSAIAVTISQLFQSFSHAAT